MNVEQGSITYDRFDTALGIQYSFHASRKLKKDYWVVKTGFLYHLDDSFTSYVYVPKGYLTNGASVPRIFWNVVPPWGHYGQACVLHDWLCEHNYYFDGLNSFYLNRKQVNNIFNDAMKVAELPNGKRKLIFGGVEAYRHIVNPGFEPKNVAKILIENELKEHFKKTGIWL